MALPTAASVVTSGLGAYPSSAIYYDRTALGTLVNNLEFYPACELRNMPLKSGVAQQIYGYTALGANTTAATEGTPGAGQALTQVTATITQSQFVDYVAFSDKSVLTTPVNDLVADGAAQLGYRGALSVDTVIRTAVDTAAGVDTNAKIELANAAYMSAAISRQAAMQLRSVNVKPKDNGMFFGIIPSLMAFDLMNDSGAGGFIDLQKYNESTVKVLQEGVKGNFVGTVGGVEWFESNNASTEADYKSAGKTGYHAYVFGKEAFIASSLGLTKPSLDQKNFKVQVGKFEPGTNGLDPAGLIAAAAFYNFFFGVTKRTGTTAGYRRITAQSTIG